MPGKKPNKKELARMKVLSDLGESATAIGKIVGKHHSTVQKYLQSAEVFTDPDISKMVEQIKNKEIDELYILGAKAKRNLHTLADGGKMKPIENIALMDRVFQQRRLLEGKSTTNVASLTSIIKAAHQPDKDLQEKAQEQEGG